MVTKKKAPAKVRTRTVYRAKPRARRANTGYDKIGPAMATAALVAVNAKPAYKFVSNAFQSGFGYTSVKNRIQKDPSTRRPFKEMVSIEGLTKDAVAVAGGLIGGEIIRKYAPTAIKKPIAKIAKKLPRLF